MKLYFTIAKKFTKTGASGLELRSASVGRAVLFNTKGDGYEKVREAAESFGFFEGEAPVSLRGIGKSYEVTGGNVFPFLSKLNLINDEQNDFILCLNSVLAEAGEIISVEISDKLAMVEMTAEGESFEKFAEGLLPIVEKYDIGIIKK